MIPLILIMVLNACIHFRKIAQNQFIQYSPENIGSAFVIVGVVWIEFALGLSWQDAVGLIIVAPPLRWIIHDLTLNYLRGLAWDYIGTRSKLDRFLRAFRTKTGLHYILVKAALIGVSVLGWWWLGRFI